MFVGIDVCSQALEVASGAQAKTYAFDVHMLAAFARVLHQHFERQCVVKPLIDVELQRGRAFGLRARQLVQMLTSQRQCLRLAQAAARPGIERVIELFEQKNRWQQSSGPWARAAPSRRAVPSAAQRAE